ncbi:hypothetical protein KRP22_014242 [Phytophthora ramorum]|nr:hypothetical protein KRP22_9158 [Phytophthora ramorum]
MSMAPLHLEAPWVHASESSFANSGQFVLDMTEKSTYADFANTPYTPHVLQRDSSLHETNRSQLWDRGQDLKKLPARSQRSMNPRHVKGVGGTAE